jgi:hypothetical protein
MAALQRTKNLSWNGKGKVRWFFMHALTSSNNKAYTYYEMCRRYERLKNRVPVTFPAMQPVAPAWGFEKV